MQVALLGDTHFGIRGDQNAFLQHMHWFFQHVFFDTLRNRNIKTIIHVGDLVDRRKYINYHTLRRMRDTFLDEIKNRNLEMHIITGNHDHYWRNTSKLNALDELLYGYDFKIYSEPDVVYFKTGNLSVPVIMVPWITQENRDRTNWVLQQAPDNAIICGHLELAGFTMNPGSVAEHGDDASLYKRFAGVYSGHYHSKSSQGNVHYLGAPFAFNWGDFNDPRGFHILDLDTHELEFIENPYSMFNQLVYDDSDPELCVVPSDQHYMDCYVKVIVRNKKSQAQFEKFLADIDAKQPLDIKIVETVQLSVDKETFSGTETTPEIIKKYIHQINTPKQQQLETKMMNLYQKALTIE